ncbi:MAG: hypothetical protein ABI655_04610 [Phenylobacterium sp.]
MNEVSRLLLLLVLAGAALTLLGGAAIWFRDEARQIRRGLKKVLKTEPEALLIARGRGRGAGFRFSANLMAVTWDAGAWCLVYRVDELIGAELIVDGEVLARVHRGEARRPLDALTGADKEVRLRLLFEDPRHPDFDLDLWRPADEGRRKAMTSPEAIFRRPVTRRAAPQVAPSAERHPAPFTWDDDSPGTTT